MSDAGIGVLKRFWEYLLSFGDYLEESTEHGGRRRIIVGALWGAVLYTLLSVVSLPLVVDAPLVNAVQVGVGLVFVLTLFLLRRYPQRFAAIFQLPTGASLAALLVMTVMLGGLYASGIVMVWGLVMLLGALVALGVRWTLFWAVVFVACLILSVALPEWIKPLYSWPDPQAIAFTNIMWLTAFIVSVMVYFVRQRDRFQQESDDLLHNILPDEIAARLKSDEGLIADDYESVSVLFADMVDFTPMSATMTPPQLIELLNDVFATFDGFVEELGLEKIRTVGDEYMVAAGVPRARPDHAHAIAELALRIRDHTATNQFDGHDITMRIGINSGPLVAGVVGTHKFSYDLWGDVVNVASRMESEGIPGSIQVTETTYDLIRERFDCEPRGVISVKGKGDMNTYLLLSRNTDAVTTP